MAVASMRKSKIPKISAAVSAAAVLAGVFGSIGQVQQGPPLFLRLSLFLVTWLVLQFLLLLNSS